MSFLPYVNDYYRLNYCCCLSDLRRLCKRQLTSVNMYLKHNRSTHYTRADQNSQEIQQFTYHLFPNAPDDILDFYNLRNLPTKLKM